MLRPVPLEIERNFDCQILSVCNHADEIARFDLESPKFVIDIPPRRGLYLWLSADGLSVDRHQFFRLKTQLVPAKDGPFKLTMPPPGPRITE